MTPNLIQINKIRIEVHQDKMQVNKESALKHTPFRLK